MIFESMIYESRVRIRVSYNIFVGSCHDAASIKKQKKTERERERGRKERKGEKQKRNREQVGAGRLPK